MYKYWFVTFSSIGSRLPGDERGSYHWDGKFIPPSPMLRGFVQAGMRNSSVKFINDFERRLVFQAIVEICKKRDWPIGALNVRTDHVHLLLFTKTDVASDTIAQAVKSKVTMRLHRNVERFKEVSPIWSRGYDKTRVDDLDAWRDLAEYALLKQGANDYLSSEQWLKYSRYWIANPYRPEQTRQVAFDGSTLTYPLKD